MRRFALVVSAALALLAASALANPMIGTFLDSPGLAIPDAGAQVSSTMHVDLPHYIASVRVYLNLTTNVSSDLRIWVKSAYDTQRLVFNIGEGGEPEVNPAGWYPTDFTPAENINAWVGEGMWGTWTVICQDLSAGQTATLNTWGVELGYDDAIATDAAAWGQIKALFR